MNYKHLSQVERYQIYALMKAGHDQTKVAKLLDRHKSTISLGKDLDSKHLQKCSINL